MRTLNLTLPLYPYMPVGNVWAWDSPFRTRDITTHKSHGFHTYEYSMHSETGTRVMIASCYDPAAKTVDKIDYRSTINRETLIVDIPKGEFEEITEQDINRALLDNPELRSEDAILIRTGWGDQERYISLGDDYAIQTPHFSVSGAERLVEVMKSNRSELLLTDCAYIGNTGEKYMYPEWASRKPWDRPPYPSQEAKIYLRHYTKSRDRGGASADWAASVPLHAALTIVAALCNCGQLVEKRIKVTVLPLFIEGGSGAPCSAVAIE